MEVLDHNARASSDKAERNQLFFTIISIPHIGTNFNMYLIQIKVPKFVHFPKNRNFSEKAP